MRLYIDFEYNNAQEPEMNLVCVAFAVYQGSSLEYSNSYWLLDPIERQQAIDDLWTLINVDECRVVSFALQAEARSLFTLMPWLRPCDLSGICLQLNYKMLLNHNHKYAFGDQLIDGKEVYTTPPNKFSASKDDAKHAKPQVNLAACTYRLLGRVIDTDRKDLMRDIIIRGDLAEIESHRDEILAYCESDIKFLPDLLRAQEKALLASGLSGEVLKSSMANMANYACRSALMEMTGYPVNVSELKKFVSHLPAILSRAADKVNKEFPEIKAFQYSKKADSYIKKERPIREWIGENFSREEWLLTDGGVKRNFDCPRINDPACKFSLSEEAWRKHFTSSDHGFGGAMVRYLSTKKSVNGFTPRKGKKSFFDRLGSDGRVRIFGGTYGSQSSRTQFPATYSLFLKAKWMRYLIQPSPGKALVGIDFGSQEFLIGGLLAGDKMMIKSYQSGDPYLAYGIAAKILPPGATKATHGNKRESLKEVVLGTQYDMGAKSLAVKLSKKSGREVSEEEAQGYIDSFYNTYADFANWKEQIKTDYYNDKILTLSDGWTCFGDNPNWRSVGNLPIQGHGAVVMRRAVELAQDAGIDVVMTLHDALYAEYDSDDFDKIELLGKCMIQSFEDVFKENKKDARTIRLDGHAWSYDYATPPTYSTFFPVDFSERYIDERGLNDLNTYKEFLVG